MYCFVREQITPLADLGVDVGDLTSNPVRETHSLVYLRNLFYEQEKSRKNLPVQLRVAEATPRGTNINAVLDILPYLFLHLRFRGELLVVFI